VIKEIECSVKEIELFNGFYKKIELFNGF